MLDLRSKGRQFDSWSKWLLLGRVTVCRQVNYLGTYLTTKVSSAFCLSGEGKLSTSLGSSAGWVHLCWVAGNTVCSHMAGDTSYSV